MAGLTNVLNVGISGLFAATQGMQTVSNNTANVNTPGYNMETVNQVALNSTDMPAGGLGNGTQVTSIQRAFNQFVYQEILGATAANQSAQTFLSNTQNLSSIFPVASGGANGLGQAIGNFFGGANTVAQNPASVPNREAMLGDAQSLVALFNSVGGTLAANLVSQNQQIGSTVSQINTLTGQIAALNQTITSEEGTTGAPPNSLLDQQDQLVQQLSQLVGVDAIQQSNGTLAVYVAGGTALVTGNSSLALNAGSGGYLDGNTEIAYGPTGQDVTSSLAGGKLGGLIAFRGQLTEVANSVGALAASLAAAVNGQQAQGLDLSGNLGQAMFSVPAPGVFNAKTNTGSGTLTARITSANALTPDNFTVTKTASGYEATDLATGQATALGSGTSFTYGGVTLNVSGTVNIGDSFEVEPAADAAQGIAMALSNPALIAASSPYVVTAGTLTSGGKIVDQNAGTEQATVGGTVSAGAVPAGTATVPAADFGQTLVVEFTSPTAFSVMTSGGTTVTSGSFSPASGANIAILYPAGAASGSAMTISLSAGDAAKGDSFVLSPAGQNNNGNIDALASLANGTLVSGETLSDYYAQLVASIGNQGQEAQVASQASQGVLTSAQNIQQSISGVNLDEQATLLVSYQQAYQASAQIIATTQSLFTGLIAAIQA